MKYLTYLSCLLAFTLTNVVQADIVVGIKEAKPFVYKNADGELQGISIDLIKQLSKNVGIKYKFVEYDNISSLLDATTNKDVDMSIAAISMTPERETHLDFSHSYFSTSMGILANTKASWWETTLWIVQRLAVVLVGFIFFLYLIGFAMDKLDGDTNIKGAHEGAWWALVTFTTTGYGDLVPKTGRGKLIASVWMVASLFLLSTFTGYVASALTVKKLSDTPMTLSDLYHTKVVTVTGSTAEHRLDILGIKHKSVTNINNAIKLFTTRKVKAVVHDDAMLNYAARTMDNVSVWSIENTDEDYAIALPQNSPLTEKVNLGILRVLALPEWKAIYTKYNVR